MKDRKSLYLLIFALTVVTIAFILISIWGYHFYFQKKEANPTSELIQKDPVIVRKTAMRDSLQTLLNSTVQQLDPQNDSALNNLSTDSTLALKLIEFNRLRNEITEILKNKSSSKDMSVASEKIGQLQQSVDELKNKNDEVAAENARLNKIVKQLMVQKKSDRKNKKVYTSPLPLLVSHLRFTGVGIKDDNERVTNIASETKKLTGSFQINVKPGNTNTSIYVVVIQPNGKTLLNSAWQSGTFETSSGNKVYSALLHFNEKDNKVRLQFSIDSRNFQKGNYVMQIYHQGTMIGRLVRTLY